MKVEAAQESQSRRPKEISKGIKYQKYSLTKQKAEGEKVDWKQGSAQKPWQQQKPSPHNYTYEQRKELGLCHKCNAKYYPGHQCTGKVMGIEPKYGPEEEVEEEQEDGEQEEQTSEEVEQAMLSMYTGCDRNKISSMKFKGYIEKVPICVLLDSGSTHSFVSPAVIGKLELPITQTNPMVVRVANGESMVTDTSCKELAFELQGYQFEKEARLLAIQGYDLILGLDWLTSLDPMRIHWSKETLEFQLKDQDVKLRVKEEKAELKLINAEINVDKEIKKGHKVMVAQIFRIEEEKVEKGTVTKEWQSVLDQFKDVFGETTGLPPKRNIDHIIPLIPDAKPINQRPYRFSYFQKLEIEKIIEELLNNSLI